MQRVGHPAVGAQGGPQGGPQARTAASPLRRVKVGHPYHGVPLSRTTLRQPVGHPTKRGYPPLSKANLTAQITAGLVTQPETTLAQLLS